MVMRLLLFILLFFTSVQIVLAQTDSSDFYIRVFGGTDATPPTTPTLLSATPVSTDQINIAWTASTDNFSVSGYNVFRDGSVIATTTLTSYSDTGLTASTTYTYQVRAFDPSLNYSTTSNSIATTTQAVPPPPPPTPTPTSTDDGANGTVVRVVEEEFVITPGMSTTSFYIKTARPARFQLHWGRTTSYELGYVATDLLLDEYETLLTDLEAGTTYEYKLVGYTPHGRETVLRVGQFTTLSAPDIEPPENVRRFYGERSGDDVRLYWEIPDNSDIAFVRIVRNHLNFPTHPLDGATVFFGNDESVLDANILSQYSPVYYTAFSYDAAGNISSGAVVIVYAESIPGDGGPVGQDQPTILLPGTDDPNDVITPPIPREVVTDERMPELFEILIEQNGRSYTLTDDRIELDESLPFTISIAKDAVTKNLKTIIASVQDPTDNRKTYAFLLRINKDRSAYEAVIPAFGIVGVSRLSLNIYDYESSILGTYTREISFIKIAVTEKRDFSKVFVLPKTSHLAILALILILFVILWWWLMMRDDDEDKR